MSELEERLQALLSDPEELSRVAQMAQSLMGQAENGASAEEPGALNGGVQRLMQNLTGGDGKNRLLQALSPYLGEERRRRLSRALRTATAARLALAALSERGADDGI